MDAADRQKTCNACRMDLPISCFVRDRSTPDGMNRRCKGCAANKRRAWVAKNRTHVAEYQREQRKLKPEIERAKNRRHTIRRKARRSAEMRARPERQRARWHLYYALKTGKVVRPTSCGGCHRECKPDAHHDDYSRPLDVRWLCRRCHTFANRGEVAPVA